MPAMAASINSAPLPLSHEVGVCTCVYKFPSGTRSYILNFCPLFMKVVLHKFYFLFMICDCSDSFVVE